MRTDRLLFASRWLHERRLDDLELLGPPSDVDRHDGTRGKLWRQQRKPDAGAQSRRERPRSNSPGRLTVC